MKKLYVVLAAAAIVLFLMTTIQATPIMVKTYTDDGGDTTSKDITDGNHDRQMQVDASATEVQLESQYQNGSVQNQFSFHMSTETGYPSENNSGRIHAVMSYSSQSNTTSSQFKYDVGFSSIIEYVNNASIANATAGYQPGEGVSTYNIGGTGWAPITYTTQNVTTAINTTATVYIFNATTSDGVFSLIAKVSGSAVTLGSGAMLTPNAIKIDIVINHFPYTVAGSSLSLVANVQTGSQAEVDHHTADEALGIAANNSESEVRIASNNTSGFFSWSDTALVGTQNVAVLNSPLMKIAPIGNATETEGETNSGIYFSFNTTSASNIFWDPKVGVISSDIKMPASYNNVTTVNQTVTVTTTQTVNATVFQNYTITSIDSAQLSSLSSRLASLTGSKSMPGFELPLVMLSLGSMAVIYTYFKKRKL